MFCCSVTILLDNLRKIALFLCPAVSLPLFCEVFWYLWAKKCCVLVGSKVESVLVFDNYNLLGEGYFLSSR